MQRPLPRPTRLAARLRPALALSAAVLATAGTAQAAAPAVRAPARTTFLVRSTLTPKTELSGTGSFTTPAGWKATDDAAHHTAAQFAIDGPGDCTLKVSVSMDGKATRTGPVGQIGDTTPLGHGTRPGGAWGTDGPTISGGEGEPLLTGFNGLASFKVQAKRYGQFFVQGILHGCAGDSPDAATFLAPHGRVVSQVNHVLATARPDVRIIGTPPLRP
jgi:hypothetical protein